MAPPSEENEKQPYKYDDDEIRSKPNRAGSVKGEKLGEELEIAAGIDGQARDQGTVSIDSPDKRANGIQGSKLNDDHGNDEDSIVRPRDEDVDDEVRSIIDHVQETGLEEIEEPCSSASVVQKDTFTIGQSSSSPPHQILTWQNSRGTIIEDKSKPTSTSEQQHMTQGSPGTSTKDLKGPSSPRSVRATNLSPSLHRNSLPPEPEPEVRFNFHLFLEQIRHRTADPVARYLRSFLLEFGKKQWTVQEQVRIISDFLTFISGKMAQCEIWRDASESEFDNAREGMEKLVMSRLYAQTFSPELPPPTPLATENRGRRKLAQRQQQNGRRGQHQEDVERDHVLSEKMQIFGWVEEQHLDIAPVKPDGKRFLTLAQQELLKINNYRAPRDKVICILNACKVIFGLLRSSKSSDTSADSFMPLLIYTVLRAKPQHMVSNIQYIFRFRNQEKLGGETGYYLSSLMGAVQFVETLDKTALTITDSEFEQRVEVSVAAIAEKRSESAHKTPKGARTTELLEPKPAVASLAARSPSRHGDGGNNGDGVNNDGDKGPVQGILRNIQRPLTSIGRMFSDEPSELDATASATARSSSERPSNESRQPDQIGTEGRTSSDRNRSRRRLAADVDMDNIVETLSSMFPSLDKEVISDIVIAKQARVGAAVDACLSLTS